MATFSDIVKEELSADMDAIKAQIKQLQANNAEKDQALVDKDKTIKDLQDRINKMSVPKKQEPKIGIGTRRNIQSRPAQPAMTPVKEEEDYI